MAEKDDAVEEKAEKSSADTGSKPPVPPMAQKLQLVDGAVGIAEQGILVLSLLLLVFVGCYQFIASRFLGGPPEWSPEAIKNLVFVCAMTGAALSAQKGQMISMDFLARKLSAKNQVYLRIAVSLIVIFACYLLYQAGMEVRSTAGDEDYALVKGTHVMLALPIGALLIALHYALHSLVDIDYLRLGQIPPEEDDGPKGH